MKKIKKDHILYIIIAILIMTQLYISKVVTFNVVENSLVISLHLDNINNVIKEKLSKE